MAFHSLQLGKLPPQLINMQQMDQLLHELALKLQVTLPNYEIATTLSSEYYKSESVIWGITNDSIIVNLPVIKVQSHMNCLRYKPSMSQPIFKN